MDAAQVLEVRRALRAVGVEIWIDGGWCVDALVGRQTREHGDLDIAVGRADVGTLLECLAEHGYTLTGDDTTTEWNFVLTRAADGGSVDVHVFEFDDDGNHVYGIAYPGDSLSGMGTIDGEPVPCISPERMFQFKTAYPPAAEDVHDVRALGERFGFEVPAGYRDRER
ncbi:nucleotidyltransferase family protein [Nocardia sp. alder85J]|uniref:nucleotidyltransferase family protein n=1 Tax=Nocardia sp. alder85J TaxID=2862949 RepID=UPI001CD48DFF|nr:nucleotidyltransferase family protein [Nocardia sp. alder85J]MCX4094351.1 nucleotidyltransferase family protein [Nocardia sp. alder85J]